MFNINEIDLKDPAILKFFDNLTEEEAQQLNYDPEFLLRDKQLKALKSNSKILLMLAGRGWGKSYVLTQIIRQWKENYPALNWILPSYGEVEKIVVSTIEEVFPPWDKPTFKLHRGHIAFNNGAKCYISTSESFERIRGINVYHSVMDELAAMPYPTETFEQVNFSTRLGDTPRIVIATTPRPIPILKSLIKDETIEVINGTSFENSLINVDSMNRLYGNSRIGRQELYGELLDDIEGALWKHSDIDPFKVSSIDINKLIRIVVAVDPAVSAAKTSDETGIVTIGIDSNNETYVLDDSSGVYSPAQWAKIVLKLYDNYKADAIIVEKNNGGDLLTYTINNTADLLKRSRPRIKTVWASKGKMARAEPIYIYYENGKVHHTNKLNKLEEQMTTWSYSSGQRSPDRVDALVWGLTELYKVGGDISDWVVG